MSHYLSITILSNSHNVKSPYYSFLRQTIHTKLVYVLSADQNLLQKYKNKPTTMIPNEVLANVTIDIGSIDQLDNATKRHNRLAQKKYKNDFFYPKGVANIDDKSEKIFH